MDRDLWNNTLISNIAGNLVRAGQHRPLVGPASAVLQAQEQSLANSLTETRDKKLKAEMANDAKSAEIKAKQITEVNATLSNPTIPYEEKVAKLSRLTLKVNDPADLAKKELVAEVERKRAARDQEMQETTFAERNNPKPKSPADPYYTALPTPGGFVSYNNRTGTGEPLVIGGEQVVRSQDSPFLQGALASSTEIGKLKGEEDQKLYERVSEAPQKLERLDQQLGLIESSDTITGLGADMLMQMERAKKLVGGENAAKLTNTQLLEVMLGADVFSMMQDMGLTSKQMDTPAEREYMRMVLAGTKELDRDVLIEMNNIKRRAIKRGIDKWNTRVEKGELKRWETATGLKAEKIEIGEKAPMPPTPGTEEGGYRFKGGDPGQRDNWEKIQ